MFGTPKRGVGAYATVGLETGVAAASPQKLVVMLYDGVIVALLSAINHIKSSNVAAKGGPVGKGPRAPRARRGRRAHPGHREG